MEDSRTKVELRLVYDIGNQIDTLHFGRYEVSFADYVCAQSSAEKRWRTMHAKGLEQESSMELPRGKNPGFVTEQDSDDFSI